MSPGIRRWTSFCRASGLDKRRSGNVLLIAPKDELAAKEQVDLEAKKKIADLEPVHTQAFQLNYTKSDDVARALTGAGGSGSGSPGTGGSSGSSTANTSRILSTRGTVLSEPRTNQLFVTDIPSKLEEVQNMITRIDVASRQVMIEARIVEASDTFGRALGVKLGSTSANAFHVGGSQYVSVGGNYNAIGAQTGQSTGTTPFADSQFVNFGAQAGAVSSTTGAASVALSLFSATAGRFLNLELSALEEDGTGRIISRPRVITAEPGAGGRRSGRAGALPGRHVQRRDVHHLRSGEHQAPGDAADHAGRQCDHGRRSEQGQGLGTLTSAAASRSTRSTSRRRRWSRMAGTVVLGGLFQQTDTDTVDKVPLLGDIPFLGNLFKSTTKVSNRTELLIFITPRIITDRTVALLSGVPNMITELQGVQKMKKWLMSAALFAAVAVLVGCSAGGKDQGGTNTGTGTGTGTVTTPTAPTVAIALSANAVTSAAPATVAATVVDSTGAALPNVVVSFSVNSAVGALSSSTALTNSKGVASVTLSPAAATASGADTVTASATVAGLTGTASAGYQVNSTTASITSIVPGTGDATTDALSSYGQTTLTLTSTGVSSAAPVTFNLTSACVAAGKATISPTSIAATTNTTTFTYKDSGGCGSTLAADTTATAIAGTSISSSTQVNLTSPTANSITFTSANPPTIFLKGSGYTESSTVSFEVVDTAGNPLPGQKVTLALSTLAGGLLLDQGFATPVQQTSDSNGLVSVIINSGTVPTPVRVTATLPSGVSTESSSLAVVTGLPSQIHFSLSQATANIEGANHDDAVNTSISINVADRSGDPVPDGTTVIFWAEGGKVTGSAMTTGGVVSVPFVSTTPKPDDGRVTILAYAIGEESFIDQSSNGANVWVQGYPFQDPRRRGQEQATGRRLRSCERRDRFAVDYRCGCRDKYVRR